MCRRLRTRWLRVGGWRVRFGTGYLFEVPEGFPVLVVAFALVAAAAAAVLDCLVAPLFSKHRI